MANILDFIGRVDIAKYSPKDEYILNEGAFDLFDYIETLNRAGLEIYIPCANMNRGNL